MPPATGNRTQVSRLITEYANHYTTAGAIDAIQHNSSIIKFLRLVPPPPTKQMAINLFFILFKFLLRCSSNLGRKNFTPMQMFSASGNTLCQMWISAEFLGSYRLFPICSHCFRASSFWAALSFSGSLWSEFLWRKHSNYAGHGCLLFFWDTISHNSQWKSNGWREWSWEEHSAAPICSISPHTNDQLWMWRKEREDRNNAKEGSNGKTC